MPVIYDVASLTSITARKIRQKKKGKEYEIQTYITTVPFKEKGKILWIKMNKIIAKELTKVISQSPFPMYLAIILPPYIERNLRLSQKLARQITETLHPFVWAGIEEEDIGKWHITFVIDEEIIPPLMQSEEEFVKWNDELFRKAQKKLEEGWILEETICLGVETSDRGADFKLHKCIRIYDPTFKPKLLLPSAFAYDYDPFERKTVYKILYTIDDIVSFTYQPFLDYGSIALFSSFKGQCNIVKDFVISRLRKAGLKPSITIENDKEVINGFKDVNPDVIEALKIILDNEVIGYIIKDKNNICRLIIKRDLYNYLLQL